jgi:prepilin-type N-terminal cleavage/methylation domain-containing protein
MKLIKKNAFSLLEILIAISIFSLTVLVAGTLVIEGLRQTKNLAQRNYSMLYIKEVFNAVTVVKNDLWSQIVANTGDGEKHLEFVDNKYTFADGAEVHEGITINLTVSTLQRDVNGNIVLSGGITDPHYRSINIEASWTDFLGKVNNVTSSIYVNDWNTYDFIQTSQAEFETGTLFQSRVTNLSGGELQLKQVFYPDWCKPTLSIDEYDLPGSATAKTLFSFPGLTYTGTGGDAGVALTKLRITGVEDPIVTLEGTFNGYTVNNIFVDGNYAYLATTNTSKDVVILDISTNPFTEVGYYNTSRTEEAESVFVVGNVGYLSAGRYVFSFNLNSKIGSRPQYGLRQVSLNQNWFRISVVSQIFVRGNYLYASLDEDWYEMAIVNVTNPSSMTIASQTNVNNQQVLDIYVSPDGNRTYFGTNSSSSEREFFIIDTTAKSPNDRPIIGSYDTNGMSVKGIAIIDYDSRAVLVGSGGEEYQTVNISNESSLSRCGGMQLNTGIYDVDSVKDVDGNSFSYIVTGDTSKDFKIFRGGPGLGGDLTGYGYTNMGSYISTVLDSSSSTTKYFYLEWKGTVPTGTTSSLQVRSSNLPDLSDAIWVGPDGTNASFFTSTQPTALPSNLNNKRYFQFQVMFTSDTISTPMVESIQVNYQK